MRQVYLGKTLINDTYVGRHRTDITDLKIINADYALVAGGGGGGAGGKGGGGGEVQTNYLGNPSLALIPGQTYWVHIGEGGSKGYSLTGSLVNEFNQGTGSNGENSFISSSNLTQGTIVTALGGGGGAGYYKTNPTLDAARSGSDGGSGGGSGTNTPGGLAIGTGYGNNGGSTITSGSKTTSAGGGGGALTTGSSGEYIDWQLYDTKVTGLVAGAAFFYKTTYFGSEIKQTVGIGFFQTNMVSGSVRPSGSFTEEDFTIETFGAPTNNQSVKNGDGGHPIIVDWIPFNNGELGAGGGAGGDGTLVGYDLFNGIGGGTTGGNGQSVDGGITATSGSQFSGAGGGGGFIEGASPFNVGDGAEGGSGFCAIRYISDTPVWTGGEISGSDGYVYHFFTASAEMSYVQS